MKLKKIASLALAGLMAVGMLAGCAAANNEPEQPGNTVPEGTTEVSAEVGSLIKAAHANFPSYVTFTNDSSLTSSLKSAVEYSGVSTSLTEYVWQDTVIDVSTLTGTPVTVLNSLTSKVGMTAGKTIQNIGESDTLQDDEQGMNDAMPSAKTVQLYAISGSIGENAINEQIANVIGNAVSAYAYNITSANGGNFNHSYAVSVSTCSKTVNSAWTQATSAGAADPTVVFVAVQVVRTSTHQ